MARQPIAAVPKEILPGGREGAAAQLDFGVDRFSELRVGIAIRLDDPVHFAGAAR